MKYIEYQFEIQPLEPWREILVAYLSELLFESFVDTENGLASYILQDSENEEDIKNLDLLNSGEVKISYIRKDVPNINWNEEWEKNFSPIEVLDQIYVRAEFHEEKPNFPYTIVIQPKMSFGTGHHETTYNMLKAMLEMNFQHKDVLDMGCGTAILGIFAKLKNAKYVKAIDIDDWCYDNAVENSQRNNTDINVEIGGADLLGKQNFDIILANINKNILLNDIKHYVKVMNKEGKLLLSGIYEEDFDDIISECNKYGLKFEKKYEKNNWISILLSL